MSTSRVKPSPKLGRKGVTASAKSGTSKSGASSAKSGGSRLKSAVSSSGSSKKLAKHVDAKVAARNTALNAMGGVKVDVFVRVRPLMPKELAAKDSEAVDVDREAATVDLRDEQDRALQFKYDKVYAPESTQDELYDDAVAPIVEQVSRGLSCAIFAYGQTGSGKTYTMRGDLKDGKQFGVIQRSIENLFRRLDEQDYANVKVSCSFLEIYNEELEDLLLPKGTTPKKLRLIDHDSRGTVCHGLSEVPVSSVDDTLKLLNDAEKKSKFSETKMNKLSNRAHRIFTVIANFKRYETNVLSTLTFIDLAGSEDISKSGAEGLTAREAMYINKSLLTLGRVINALACNEKHIPYRDSKLTRLLSEALGGVCKTSFIACVSPAASSRTESNSTLRYAERAMEALNISQLPRWKQDEIMIDGLTRRVQALMADLESQAQFHKEEMQELRNTNTALQAENADLKAQIERLNYRVDKLQSRKSELKTGLSVMTAQRDMLQFQKEQLREELLDTRCERDGYLNDRAILSQVLNDVRSMRDRLLEAHTKTETSLTKDANELKRVVESAIADIGTLHEEVARKKALSVHNEKAADEYRDRLSEQVRGVIQSVLDFKTGQDSMHVEVADALVGMRNTNQQDTAANRSAVTSIQTKTAEVLANIAQHAKETEQALLSRVDDRRAGAEQYRSSVAMAVKKFQAAVASQLEQFRAHADSLDKNMATWAEKVNTKLAERAEDVKKFSASVGAGLAGMQSALDASSTKQIEMLKAHGGQLDKHLEDERTTLAAESDVMIKDIQSYVSRMVSDFASKATRRTEAAVSTLKAQTEESSVELRHYTSDATDKRAALDSETSTWQAAAAKSLDDGSQANAAMHAASGNFLKEVLASVAAGEKEVNAGADATDTLAATHLEKTVAVCKENAEFATARKDAVAKKAFDGTQMAEADSDALRAQFKNQAATHTAAADTMKSQMDSAIADVRSNADVFHEGLVETEEDGVDYVMQQIKRDTKSSPPEKEYDYPVDYQETDPYAAILNDLPVEWAREDGIRNGNVIPGKGPDFPGELGPEDSSGVYSETVTKPLAEDDASKIEDAARASDTEEYEMPALRPAEVVVDDHRDEASPELTTL